MPLDTSVDLFHLHRFVFLLKSTQINGQHFPTHVPKLSDDFGASQSSHHDAKPASQGDAFHLEDFVTMVYKQRDATTEGVTQRSDPVQEPVTLTNEVGNTIVL